MTEKIITTNQKIEIAQKVSDSTLFTSDYLLEYGSGPFFILLKLLEDKFIGKEWTVDDAEMMFTEFASGCVKATTGTCDKFRDYAGEITGIRWGQEPCKICPFNNFCSNFNKDENSWHFNLVKLIERAEQIWINEEVSAADRTFINDCISKLQVAPELNDLYNLFAGWDK
jgi:hypothetical protein